MQMWRRSWMALAIIGLLVSSCGSGSDTEAGAEAEESSAVDYESPLGEFLGWDQEANFDADAAQAEYAEQDRLAQEAIATCMAEQGFEYIPIDVSAQDAFFEEQFEEGIEWGSEEWTATYGFGVSTQRFSQEQVGPDLVGHTYLSSVGVDDGPPDPNNDYVNSLGPNEQTAYYEALYGGPDDYPVPVWEEEGRDPTEEEMIAFDEAFEENYTPSGCEPIAYEEIYSEQDFGGDWEAFDVAFGDALMEMEERMESHPDVLAFREGVEACVKEQGLEFLTEEEAWSYFEQELNAAGLGWETMPDPFEGLDTSNFTDEDYERVWREAESALLPADKLAALAEVQAEEIETAVALFGCGGGWENEFEALQDVRIQLEEEFLAANADALAEFEGVFGS